MAGLRGRQALHRQLHANHPRQNQTRQQHRASGECRQQDQSGGDGGEDSCSTVCRTIVQHPKREQIDRNRDRDRRAGTHRTDCGVVRHLVDDNRQPGADGRGRGEDQIVAVAPDDGGRILVSRSWTGRSK